ncbi:MAG: hypothetical protein HWE25_02625 [Alphaproteobacteria bacterium]|nr:hypothetical protein [Alphaproteobacteria bacterium]
MTLQQRFNLVHKVADYGVLVPAIISLGIIYLELMPILWILVVLAVTIFGWVMICGPLIKVSLKCPQCDAPAFIRHSEEHDGTVIEARALDACHKCGHSFIN